MYLAVRHPFEIGYEECIQAFFANTKWRSARCIAKKEKAGKQTTGLDDLGHALAVAIPHAGWQGAEECALIDHIVGCPETELEKIVELDDASVFPRNRFWNCLAPLFPALRPVEHDPHHQVVAELLEAMGYIGRDE